MLVFIVHELFTGKHVSNQFSTHLAIDPKGTALSV